MVFSLEIVNSRLDGSIFWWRLVEVGGCRGEKNHIMNQKAKRLHRDKINPERSPLT